MTKLDKKLIGKLEQHLTTIKEELLREYEDSGCDTLYRSCSKIDHLDPIHAITDTIKLLKGE